MAVERERSLKPKGVASAKSAGEHAELLTGGKQFVPHSHAGGLVRGNVDLKAILSRVAGASDQRIGQSTDGAMSEPIELHLREVGVRKLLQSAPAIGPLNGYLGIAITEVFHFTRKVLGRVTNPGNIFLTRPCVDYQQVIFFAKAVHDHIIDKGPRGIEQGRVLSLSGGEVRGIIEGHVLHGLERRRAMNPDVSHVADVEESDGAADGHVLGNQASRLSGGVRWIFA